MSDYESTWRLRQQYYSNAAIEARDLAETDARLMQQTLEESAMAAAGGDMTSPDQVGAGLRRPVEQPKGRASETGEALGTIGENIGERALDAIPSIGVGIIAMADNVLDFGAHVTGLEDHYAQASRWLDERVDIYQPETTTGPIVAAISQLMTPFAGTAKALHVAGVSRVLSNLVAAGTADGLAIAPANANFAEVIKGFVAENPAAPDAVHIALLEALSKTPDELRILAQAEARAAAGESLTEADPAAGFDPEAYREVYFEARLKNAVAGIATEAFAEALMLGARGIYRTSQALADPAARKALGRTLRRSTDELDAGAGRGDTLAGSMALEGLTPAAGARAVVASPVDSAAQVLEEAQALQRATRSRQLSVVAQPAADGVPAPAARLAAVLAGSAVPGAAGAGALMAPTGASEDDVRAWLGVLGAELGVENLSARRFNYLTAPPEDMAGKGTSVLYRAAEAPTERQLARFRERMGGRYALDVRQVGGGVMLDVHPSGGAAADPALLEAAVRDAGLDPDAASLVFSEYSEITVDSAQGAQSMARWQASVEREEARTFASQVGGMEAARAMLRGETDLPQGKRLAQRIAKAREKVLARVSEAEAARAAVRETLDADATQALMQEVAR